MAVNRRQFLLQAASGAAMWPAFAPRRLLAQDTPRRQRVHAATLDPEQLTHFVDPLPRPAIAQPVSRAPLVSFRLRMAEADCHLHRDLPPTRCWTFEGSAPGPTIEVRSGEATRVEWVNALPPQHFLPVDHHLEGAQASLPEVRAVVHLHGGRVPPESDGNPERWTVPGGTQVCEYPNRQEAALLFYHDHTMGLNRLNIYAGLFGLVAVRDEMEEGLKLPRGEFEIPLVLCDRWLDPHGQLYYPVSGIPGAPWVSEVFGNAILINGKLWPELVVEPRAYRFRIANIANGRFFQLAFSPRQHLHLIGTDQGLLGAPVALNGLLLAPAERADAVVDFSRCAGETLHLMNESVAIMRVRVRSGAPATGWQPPIRLRDLARLPAAQARRRRRLRLEEYDDLAANPILMLLDGKRWGDAVSERPELGSTEIWEFVNLTDDTHPIHLHLVRFQLLERQPFDAEQYLQGGGLRFTGRPAPPGSDEMGWKDTVRCYAEAVTRIIVRFEGYAGRYLWHCHVLEHEANQMMRPYEIVTGS